ncbi:MAG TPA: hypothetical protein DDW95_05595 [Alphaproteobacteria bacterium]|nr:hypothetical protein [Alphaproteobacteria bacterium]HBF98003.1 hypothetical protein [Alphaproteobacteria bacterium]
MYHPALKTPLCEMLGIDYPIIQAGMGFVARGPLAGAVSAAGGLGCIGAASMTGEELREEIRIVREITDKPFAVDILFATTGGKQTPVFTSDVQDHIDVIFDEKVPVLASGLGNPGPIIDECHAAGMKVLSLTGNTKNAKRLADSGVDAVIAQGYDGGGHTGRVGAMTLLPAVIDAVDVPVLAAGGIGDGRGIAAAITLGAIGVWLGTRFIATPEAWGHDNYKRRITEIDDEGTTRTRCFSGKPCRMIQNDTTKAWESPELEASIRPFPRQMANVTEWLGKDPYMAGRRDGETDIGALAAGQSSALIHEVKPVAQLIEDLMTEASATLDRITKIAAAAS